MTVAKNVLNRIHVQRLLLAVALLGFSLSVTAAKLPGWGSVPYGQSGKNTTFGLGNQSGSITPPPGWQAAGNYGIPKAPVQGTSFALGADGKVFIPNKAGYYDGVMYPYRVGGDLKWGDLAAAAAGFLGGPLGVACMLACPLALNWMDQAGVRIDPKGGGLERVDSERCYTAPCFKWKFREQDYYTHASACQAWVDATNLTEPDKVATAVPSADSQTKCRAEQKRQDGGFALPPNDYNVGISVVPIAPSSPTWYPTTPQAVKDALYNFKPDPGVVGELLKQGADIPLPAPLTVTGPTSIAGKENSTTNADGSRTVEKTTYNFQTSGNTITNVSNVTTTTTYNTDNSVRNTTTTTNTPSPEEAEKDPEDPCKKNPDRIGCMELDTPEGEIPKTTKNITFEAEDVLGGGACPANVTTSFNTLGGQSATIVDWQTFCGHALPLRALVMGLAAIMAFFIIMPGGVRE